MSPSDELTRDWWQTHLPDLTGPLSVEDCVSDPNCETAATL